MGGLRFRVKGLDFQSTDVRLGRTPKSLNPSPEYCVDVKGLQGTCTAPKAIQPQVCAEPAQIPREPRGVKFASATRDARISFALTRTEMAADRRPQGRLPSQTDTSQAPASTARVWSNNSHRRAARARCKGAGGGQKDLVHIIEFLAQAAVDRLVLIYLSP